MHPWYAEGLRFECTRCGACCSGPPGYVLYTDAEAVAIAAKLGIEVPEFIEKYTSEFGMEISGRTRTLREVPTEHGLDCVFLDRISCPGSAVCSIHDVRPSQCQTFPFWPEHIESPRTWQRAARYCEGIGRGEKLQLVQIRIQLERHRADRAQRG